MFASDSSESAKIKEKFNASVNSEAEAKAWKEKQCKDAEQSEKYKANKKRCMKEKDTERCTMVGKCFLNSHENKNVCRYCYRFVI